MRFSTSTGPRNRAAWAAFFAIFVGLVPGIAGATTYYVSPTGSGTNSGLSPSAPLNVSTLNARLVAGDVAYVLPGTYTTQLKPVNHGRAGARITIIGNLANPSEMTFNSGFDSDRSYITVKGLKFQGAIAFVATSTTNTARYDSAAYCIARGAQFVGAKNSIICKSIIDNDAGASVTCAFVLDGWNDVGPRPWASNSESDTLRGNTINCRYSSFKAFMVRGHTQKCLIDSNRVTMRWQGDPVDQPSGRAIYNSYYNTFRDNSWVMEADNPRSGGKDWFFCGMRDSSAYNLFERDTILAGLQGGVKMYGWMQQSGVDVWVGQETRNQFKNCVYRVTGAMVIQQIGQGLNIDHCEFSSTNDHALEVNNGIKYFTFNNNTCYSTGTQAIEIGTPSTACPADSIRFTNNIFYARSAGASNGVLKYWASTGFVANNNLFYSPAFSTTPGDRSVGYGGVARSVPNWCSTSSRDCNSKSGDPLFVSTASLPNLNLRLTANSPARGLAMGGADAGAYSYGADTNAPSAITLTSTMISDQTVVLQWTATGDNGTSGTAAAYDLRMSNATITSTNFGSASVLPSLPVPLPSGTVQSYIVTNLTPGTAYSFAIKARDAAGNWSPLSNVLNLSTASSDLIKPDAVKDLSTSSSN